MAAINWGGIQWGTVGEWFSGLGGLLAVLVVLSFARSERKRAVAESQRADRAERQAKLAARSERNTRRRHDAALLSFRVRECSELGAVELLIDNRGSFPFLDVHAIAEWPDGSTSRFQLEDVMPAACLVEPFGRNRLVSVDMPSSWRIEYTDIDGLRWRQRSAGVLEQLEDQSVEP